MEPEIRTVALEEIRLTDTHHDPQRIVTIAQMILANKGLERPIEVRKDLSILAGEPVVLALKAIVSQDTAVWGQKVPSIDELTKYANVLIQIYSDLSELEEEKYSLLRDLERQEEMAWQVRPQKLNQLHEICQSLYGHSQMGRGKRGWGVRDTAALLGWSRALVGIELQLARALMCEPALAQKSRKIAVEAIQQKRLDVSESTFRAVGRRGL